MAITAVPDLYLLVQDYTIDPSGGTTGGNFVDQSFELHATAPITVNGGAVEDFATSPIVIAADLFSAVGDGIVPSPGIATTTFLRADGTWATEATFVGTTPGLVPGGSGNDNTLFLAGDGTWAAGTIAGVSSVTGTAPIVVSPTVGAAVVSIDPANLTTPGHVPAVGAVDSSMALLRTNPPTWGTVGLTGFIQLQATYPGTAQTGNGHITGTFGAQTALVAGSDKKSLNGSGAEPLYVKQPNGLNCPVIASYQNSATIIPGLAFRAARGTEAVPTIPLDGDELLRISSSTYSGTGSVYFDRDILTVTHGSIAAGPGLGTTLRGWATDASTAYLHLSKSALAGINTFAPESGFEVATSFGLKTIAKSANFVVGEAECLYTMDASGASCRATLPPANGRFGRIHGFTNIGSSAAFPISQPYIIPNGGELIQGASALYLPSYGDTVWLVSDDTNWWIINNGIGEVQIANRSDGSAVGASSTAEKLAQLVHLFNVTAMGTVFGLRAYGTYSTNGTPNMTFRVRETGTGGAILQTMGTVAGASGVTNSHWALECEWIVRTVAGGAVTVGQTLSARLELGNASQVLTMIGGTLLLPAGPISASGSLALALTHEFGASHANNNVQVRGITGWVKRGTMLAF